MEIEMKMAFLVCIVSTVTALIMVVMRLHIYKKVKSHQIVNGGHRDHIEDYVIKTAPGASVRIGKIHAVGKRPDQQDTLAYSDVEDKKMMTQKGMLLIVADGMGGLSAGAEVSSLTAVEMLRYFDGHSMWEKPADALRDALLYANERVNTFLGSERIGKCGSTVVAAMIKEHNIYWISVGDSSVFLYHEQRLTRLNVLHNYATELQKRVDRGEITEEEAQRDPQRAALTSFIGQGKLEQIDSNTEPLILSAQDRFMLATDGICEAVDLVELESLMHFDAGDSAWRIQQMIKSKDKRNQDNYTAIIIG